MKDEALRLALEALKKCDSALAEELAAWDIDPPLHHVLEASNACGLAITAIKEVLAQPVATSDTSQKPVDETTKQRHEPEPVQQEKDWGDVAEKRLSALKQDAKRRMQDAKRRMEDAAVRAVHKIMQKEPEPVPESTLMALGMKDEALRLALEALLEHGSPFYRHEKQYNHAITASIEALAQPEPEPVAYEPVWDSGPTNKDYEDAMRQRRLNELTSPPKREWQGLTDEEVFDIWLNEMPAPDKVFYQKLCRSVEAKLKEKNT